MSSLLAKPRGLRQMLDRAESWLVGGIVLIGCAIGVTLWSNAWPAIEEAGGAAFGLICLGLLLRERRLRGKQRVERRAAQEAHREFVATVSHDLRTPLTSLLGFSQLLCEDQPLEAARQERYHTILRAQAASLSRLVEDVVDLARLADGSLALRPSAVGAAELVEDAALLYTPAEVRTRLHLGLTPGLPPLWVDRGECEQVLDRLFHLALTVSEPEQPVVLTAEPEGRAVRFTLVLPGVTLDDPSLHPLLDAKVTPALSRAHDRQLGLLVARALVEAQGGRLQVEASHAPEGVAVSLSLPATRTSAASAGQLPAADALTPVGAGVR